MATDGSVCERILRMNWQVCGFSFVHSGGYILWLPLWCTVCVALMGELTVEGMKEGGARCGLSRARSSREMGDKGQRSKGVDAGRAVHGGY